MTAVLDEHTHWPDEGGKPFVAGKVFFGTQNTDPTVGYPAAPVNLITIYSDRALTVPIVNPQTIDSQGRTTNKIYVPDKYSIAQWDSDDVQKYINLDAGRIETNSESVSFLPAGTDAVETTVQAKLRESASVFDSLTPAEIADVQSGSEALDVTAAVAAWLLITGNLKLNAGTYMVDGNFSVLSDTHIHGEGTLKLRIDTENPILNLDNVSNISIRDITLDGNKSIVTGSTARGDREGLINGNALADGNTTTDIYFDNIKINNSHLWGIRFYGLQQAVITKCQIEGADARGLGGGSNWLDVGLDNNYIDNCFQSGISINGQGSMSSPSGTSERVNVTNNRVSNINNDVGLSSSGIGIEVIGECTDSNICDNTVTDCDSMLISTGFTSRLTVTGNTGQGAVRDGSTKPGIACEITGNTDCHYANNNFASITIGYILASCQNVSIVGGNLQDTLRTSKAGTADDTTVVHVKGNLAPDGLFGYEKTSTNIRISNLQSTGFHQTVLVRDRVQKMEVLDNTFDSPYNGVEIGIAGLTVEPNEITVKGNLIRSTYNVGILLHDTSNAICRENILFGERAASTGISMTGVNANHYVDENTLINITTPGSGITVKSFTSTDATPTVAGRTVFKTTGTTAITDFDDGVVSQTITILATASITITDGSPIILNGSADFTMVASDTLTLTMFNDQVWQEIGRSVN